MRDEPISETCQNAIAHSVQRVVRDRQVWIRSRGGNPAIVGKGYPLCELMTKDEAVAEANLWPRKFYAVRIRIVPNVALSGAEQKREN